MKGIELKRSREDAGLTQKELADKLGKTMRTLITWEQSEILSHSQSTLVRSVLNSEKNVGLVNESEANYEKSDTIDEIINRRIDERLEPLTSKVRALKTEVGELKVQVFELNLKSQRKGNDRKPLKKNKA